MNNQIFSPNRAFDSAIKQMLPKFDERSRRRMQKAIKDAGKAAIKQGDENADAGARHIVREFIPAYLLNCCGYELAYEHNLEGKTPDWVDLSSKLLVEVYTFERYSKSPFPQRVLTAIAEKYEKYESAADRHELSVVIAVHLDFLTAIDFEDCYEARRDFVDLFSKSCRLWGVLFFAEENSGIWIGGTPYGFMCLTTNESLKFDDRWQLPTYSLND